MTPRRLAAIGAAVLAIAAAARVTVTIPGSDVPQSLQTLAVLVFGALLGARGAAVALAAYLAAGALGAPVFADGAAGVAHLVGPTAGYLAGFAIAAIVVGRLTETGHLDGVLEAIVWMIAGHAIILGLGVLWLGTGIDLGVAVTTGFTPFLRGAAAKSLAAAALVVAWRRIVLPRVGPGPDADAQ
jgi:biotin transport system substrate-specific component